jgi:hypothetical protein
MDAGLSESLTTEMATYKPDCDESGKLGDFLNRPVAINTFSWVEGSTPFVQTTFTPWSLYFNTPSIRNKISNYARIRCKLKLKFVVNASPFYYGAMRVCYCPLTGGVMDNVSTQIEQIKMSQMPGGFLYPADMTSFEMELPFLWPGSWLDLGELDNFTQMGRISYILYSVLQSANGVPTTNATITCYAWAEDVELAGLTSGLVLQADEYTSSGVISGPASTVASIAGKLRTAPVIGPFARATEIGAKAVGGIASLFGYSNPPVIDDAKPVVIKSFHAMASVETSIPSDKLAVDPKNEITIDKVSVGASADDPLIITKFCGHESWVTGSLWTEAYAPGTQLLAFPVTPRLYASAASAGSSTIYSETPMCHASAMFLYWRGSIHYKLKFVKSRYHTGRVQISWDPSGTPGTNSETTTMTRIVDLQTESEMEFSIPYKSANPWLTTNGDPNVWANTTGGTVTYMPSQYNGVVKITVLNELTGPAASQSIDVLLFARVGADFKLSSPSELPDFTPLQIQSLELVNIDAGAKDDNTNSVTVGEDVVSLRQLLHRSSYWHTQPLGNPLSAAGVYQTTNLYTNNNYIPRFPLEPGFSNNSLNFAVQPVAATNAPYQYSPNHPLNWLGNCFAGYRGGIVHHYNVITNGAALVDSLKAEHDPRSWILTGGSQARNRFSIANTTASPSTLARSMVTTTSSVKRTIFGQRGMALTNTNTQTALSVVSPQYSRYKFKTAYVGSLNTPMRDRVDSLTFELDSLRITSLSRAGSPSSGTDAGWPMLEIYMAGAVDFDLIYFICVPTYFSFSVPNAVDLFSP